jgi:ankyrin repeat protein
MTLDAFVDAATNGRADRARALLERDPELSRARLDAALVYGERTELERALAEDPNVVARPLGARGWLPLLYVTHSAFLSGDRTGELLACARLLLDAGADPNSSWEHPEFGALSALYGAAGVAHEPRMTALLLERGATPDDGESLYHSCEARDHACLRLLLDAGARVEGTNALGHMLDYDDVEGLRLLLQRGVEESTRDWPELQGAIGWALSRDRSREHIELLLRHGAAIQPSDATLAVRRGRSDLVDLLGRGSPTPADELVGALRRGDRAAVEGVLAANPGLLERLERADHDVLVHAAGRGNQVATELMLELGFPIDVRSEELNETPLHAASWYGRSELAKLLLAHGADPNAQAGAPFGGRPLDWAAHGSRHADPAFLGEPRRGDYTGTVEVLRAAGAVPADPDLAADASDEVIALLRD